MKERPSHKILLVDDEPYVTEALKRILHKKDLDVFTAESANEALNLLAQEPIDIVVSDEKMPGLCGSEFLALVYQKYPETVRIILTGHADLEMALRAINIGQIHRFLIKPINELELEVTIRQAIQHKELLTKSSRLLTTVRQQQALLQERYQNVIETIEEGYYEVDLDGNLIFFNDALARIIGYPREDLVGVNIRQYTDEENYKIVNKEFKQIYHTGKASKGIQFEVITKYGERITVETSVSLIKNALGNPIGFKGMVRDISELRQAQKSLMVSEERFRLAAESSNDFIYEWNLQSGQVNWFGKAVERLGDMLGELPDTNDAFVKRIYPEDLEFITEAVRRHLKKGEPHLVEYRLVGKNGNIIHMKSAGMGLRDEAGRVYKWIGALSNITGRKKAEEELRQSLEKLHKVLGGVIQAMALAVESKDPYTAGHQTRVSSLARSIAQEMGLSNDQVESIRLAGIIHDLGKISVPGEILSKPTKLSDLEFALLKGHPQTGYDILKDIEFPWPIAEIVLQHHERLDGSGYPAGLKGDQILPEAQILMVADVVEALATHRPYRPSLGIDVALEEISKNNGKLFNPIVVEACLRLFSEKRFELN